MSGNSRHKLNRKNNENNFTFVCDAYKVSLFIFTNRRRHWVGAVIYWTQFCLLPQVFSIACENSANVLKKNSPELKHCAAFLTFYLNSEEMCKLVKWYFPTRSKWESFGLLCQQTGIKSVGSLFQFDVKYTASASSISTQFRANANVFPLARVFCFPPQLSASFVYLLSRLWPLRFSWLFIAFIMGN